MKVYLIGSMRNPQIPLIANTIREHGYEVFDDWYSPGPETDDKWQAYEQARGRTYIEALNGAHALNVFEFDKEHLDEADIVVMATPCGRSAHMELGYILGTGRPGYILLDGEPTRWDIMYQFATKVCPSLDDLLASMPKPLLHTRTTNQLPIWWN